MTKAALNEARKHPESDYTPGYPAAARVFDAIVTSGMEATANVQMHLPAASVASTTIPSRTISVFESLCADPLLNRVQWELYLPAHRHEFVIRKLSEMARCRRETLEVRDPPPVVVAKSAGSKAPERLPHDSTPAPAAPEVPTRVVVGLRGFVMKVCRDFSQFASWDWTLVTCCASFYMCIAIICTRKQIHRRAPPGGRLVFSFLAVSVLLQLLSSTVGAAKPRPLRDATSNVWAEGKPNVISGHTMAAGPDGSLWVFGGILLDQTPVNDLFKLDLDTKEWGATSTCLEEGILSRAQVTRMTSFGSRRRSRSGYSSMRHGSRAPRRACDPVTVWWPWGETSTCSEVQLLLVSRTILTRMNSFGSRRLNRSGSSSMRHGSRAPRRARDQVTAWCPWGATSTCSEGKILMVV
jgi:hypothetical protein